MVLTSAKDRIVTVAILNLAVHRPEVIGPNYSFVLNTVGNGNTNMPWQNAVFGGNVIVNGVDQPSKLNAFNRTNFEGCIHKHFLASGPPAGNFISCQGIHMVHRIIIGGIHLSIRDVIVIEDCINIFRILFCPTNEFLLSVIYSLSQTARFCTQRN